MPRGDGTGPAGGGGRGCGRARGRGRGQGLGLRRGLQAGVGNQTVKPAGLPGSTSGSNRIPVAVVVEEACTLCGACQAACPTEAITLGKTAVKVNAKACCGCGACVEVCPNGALRLG